MGHGRAIKMLKRQDEKNIERGMVNIASRPGQMPANMGKQFNEFLRKVGKPNRAKWPQHE